MLQCDDFKSKDLMPFQVGGDGLFQEVLNGVMAVRCCEDTTRAAAAGQLRLGHIPGGSTDAVAYSLNGTRSAVAAALHVALGDRCCADSDFPGFRHSLATMHRSLFCPQMAMATENKRRCLLRTADKSEGNATHLSRLTWYGPAINITF